MREALDRLLGDVGLVTLALAIAIGWSLFQLASGIGDAVSTLLIDYPSSAELVAASRLSEPLTWEIGGRILMLGPTLRGAVELALVLLVAVLVHGRFARTGRA